MFSIPGIVLLLIFIFVRPQEFIPGLKSVPLLYIFFGLAVIGWVLDLRLLRSRPLIAPQLGWVVLFFLWGLVTLGVRAPAQLPKEIVELAIPIGLFIVIAH